MMNIHEECEKLKEIEQYRHSLNSKFFVDEKIHIENENLRQQINQLNARIQALQSIIDIQTEEINASKVTNHILQDHDLKTNLLKKWREKVFKLLVNLKMNEIQNETMNHKHQNTIRELNDKILELKRQIELQKKRESDLKAELEIVSTSKLVLFFYLNK